MAEISISPDSLRAVYDQIADLDIRIDASTGGKAAGKRAVKNTIKAETEASWTKQVSKVEDFLNGIEDQSVLLGTVTALSDLLKNYAEKTDAFLTEQVDSQKSDVEPVSQEEVVSLLEERKTLVEQYGTLRDVLELFATSNPEFSEALSTIPQVKNRRATSGGGKRPREISMFSLTIDGEVQAEATLSSIAAEEGITTGELKEHLKSQGVELTKSGLDGKDSFEATLPSGKVFAGVRSHVDAA